MDNLRRFLFTLSVAAFIALCVGGYVTALHYDPKEVQQEPGNPTPLPPVGKEYDPAQYTLRDTFDGNVLYILTSAAQKKPAVNFLISKYSPITQEMSFLIVPDSLKAVDHAAGNKVITLGEYFGQHGGEGTAKYLTSLFGIDVSSYTTFTYDSLSEFIAGAGSVKCSLPYALKFTETDTAETDYAASFNYPAGDCDLSGSSAVNLIKFINDTGAYLSSSIVGYYGDADPLEIHSSMSDDFAYWLLTGFVNETLAPENKDRYQEILSPLLRSGDTNLTEKELEGMLCNLEKTDHSKIKFYLAKGTYQSNKKFYILYNNILKDLKTGKDVPAHEVLDYIF